MSAGELEERGPLGRRSDGPVHRTLTFRKVIEAPPAFVFRWCTDYREDDHRLTDDLYQYRARVLLREPRRIVRAILVPEGDPLRTTEVEIIRLRPPDRWTVRMLSGSVDRIGYYRLRRLVRGRTLLTMRFHERWRVRRVPSRAAYRRLFHRVWDRYVERLERERRSSAWGRKGPRAGNRRTPSER